MSPADSIDVTILQQSLQKKDFKKLRTILKEAKAADISDAFIELDLVSCIVLFRLVSKQRRAEVFTYLPFEWQMKLLDELPDLVSNSLIFQMDPVDRTALLQNLAEEKRERLILELPPDAMQMTWKMLSYKPDSVGRLMSPEFFSIPVGMTVQDALAAIRWSGSRVPENLLNQIYVVGADGKLLGHVNLSSLVLADPSSQLVEELMDRSVMSLKVEDEREEAVAVFRKYDKPYIPVVNPEQKMLGLIEAEDVFDVAEEEATYDIQSFGGQSGLTEAYFQASFRFLWQKRMIWMLVLFLLSTGFASLMQLLFIIESERELLLLYLPMVLALGGMAASQSAALAIRGLSVREIASEDLTRFWLREASLSLCQGLVLSLGLFALSYLTRWLSLGLTLELIALLLCVLGLGASLGSFLPFLSRRWNWDPVVASAPIIASLTDILGLVLFFLLISWAQHGTNLAAGLAWP